MAKPRFTLAETIVLMTTVAAILALGHFGGGGRDQSHMSVLCVASCVVAFLVFVLKRALRDDSRYRLIQTTDANSGVTTITRDGVGNVTEMTDPVGNETHGTYDSLNRPVTETV
jgi:YD repeat-containing protein